MKPEKPLFIPLKSKFYDALELEGARRRTPEAAES
jgi:hypothetical protein